MNRLFTVALSAGAAALGIFFLALLFFTVEELLAGGPVTPPDGEEIVFALKLSLFTATVASLLALLVSLPVAYLLARFEFAGKALLDTLLDLPLVLSPIALGAMLLIFFNTAPGRALDARFGPFVFTARGIVLAQFCVVVGLSLRLLKNAFEGIDPEYEHLARTLGCNRLQVFLRVVVPMARKGILAAALLTWGRAIGEFGATVTLAGATPFRTETIPVAISLSFGAADISSALVFILILVAVSLGILFAVRRIGQSGHE
jgi:molybdate transport system permease protein